MYVRERPLPEARSVLDAGEFSEAIRVWHREFDIGLRAQEIDIHILDIAANAGAA